DYQSAHRMAHTLKGAAGDIGATQLSAAAKHLESALLAPVNEGYPAAVDAVETLLVQQISNIQHAIAPLAGESELENSAGSEAALGILLREMAKLLRNDDAQVIELLAPLALRVRGSTLVDEYSRLEELVQRFSLQEALLVLQSIATSMNITLD
ncbi:MAG: Hpt domain-containing protein, partial [Rhodoferax sp.]